MSKGIIIAIGFKAIAVKVIEVKANPLFITLIKNHNNLLTKGNQLFIVAVDYG